MFPTFSGGIMGAISGEEFLRHLQHLRVAYGTAIEIERNMANQLILGYERLLVEVLRRVIGQSLHVLAIECLKCLGPDDGIDLEQVDAWRY